MSLLSECQEDGNSLRTEGMGSVQRCFSWELVAASIIWHRLQPGVTFVLQDGWLCMTRTLLTLSLRWTSRRETIRGIPLSSHCSKNEAGCNVILFSTFIKLNLVSDIETYTLWKLTYKESFPQDIGFAQATAEIVMKNVSRSPGEVLLCLYHRSPPLHLFFNASIKTD